MKKPLKKALTKTPLPPTMTLITPNQSVLQPGNDIVGDIKALFPPSTIFWHDQLRQTGVSLNTGFGLRHFLLEDFELHEWLHLAYLAEHHSTLNQLKLQEALRSLRYDCFYKGESRESYVRSARIRDVIYIDLGSQGTVRIDADGWQVSDDSEVIFIRTDDVLPQCAPEKGGEIGDLRAHLNVASEDEFQLLVAFVIQCLSARAPYPLLSIIGEQGSGKSHTCEKIASLVAPSRAPLKTMPSSDDAFKLQAVRNRFCIVDNLSALTGKQADLLCQLSTGIGYSYKPPGALEPTLLMASCPVILNGINNVVTRPDLLERTITLNLQKITSHNRKPLQTLWQSFEAAKPRILGVLYDGISSALRREAEVVLEATPRMADFAVFATAAQQGLGWSNESFLEAYYKVMQDSIEDSLQTDPLALILIEYMQDETQKQYEPSQWVEELKEFAKNRRYAASLPTNPRALSEAITRLGPMLDVHGLDVTSGRSNGRRYIRFVNANPKPRDQ